MRGDSLRDLYAKTLALLGLGVLAGAGALVDYWPVGLHLVPAAPALQLPDMASAVVVPVHSVSPVLPTSSLVAVKPANRDTTAPQALPLLPISEVEPPLTAALTAPELVDVVALVAPAPVLAPSDAGADAPIAAVFDAALVDSGEAPVDTLATMSPWREPVTLADAGTSETDDGFFSGALRKTRSSLLRTGARTGASIVDAVRVVGGAVRRALPN